ncbi:MAG: hypothetical protein E5V74_12730 [Mesorhizobium sp.]|nr:MAG: hypothetical protein E5V74_12730 [Mesorhizobium sp.]
MVSAANGYDFSDIKAVARELVQSDPSVSIEDIVLSLYEDLYEGQPCPPALIEAVKQALQHPAGGQTGAGGT